jgi:zinc protease
MFRGTEKYPNYDAETTKMGAFRNASTWPDQTAYYLVANTEYLEQIIDIESDRFQNLKYAEPDFRTEAGAILGEYQQGAREPARFLNEKVREAAFDRHTYAHTTIGYEKDVRAMPDAYDYSLDFYRRHYRPENVVIVIAGDFDTARARTLIQKYYAGWKGGYKAPAIQPEPPQQAPRERTVEYPAARCRCCRSTTRRRRGVRRIGRPWRSRCSGRSASARTPRSFAASFFKSAGSRAWAAHSASRAIRTWRACRRW